MMVLLLTLGWLGDGGGLQHEQGVGDLQGSSSPLHPAAVVTWKSSIFSRVTTTSTFVISKYSFVKVDKMSMNKR